MQLSTPPYKTLKTSLLSVVRNPSLQETIQGVAANVSKITSRTLMFLKLYLLHHQDNIPIVTTELVDTILKIVSTKISNVGNKPSTTVNLRAELTYFHHEHFLHLVPLDDPPLPQTNLSEVFDYEATKIVTAFETNIKQRYVGYVESYVNAYWKKDELLAVIAKMQTAKRERVKRKLFATLRTIKTDLLNVGSEPLQSHPSYHGWVLEHRKVTRPLKSSYQKDSIYYDLQCTPQEYYLPMLRITQYLEEEGKRLKNCCPLSSSEVPKHFRIGTNTLVLLLYKGELGVGKGKLHTGGEMKRRQHEIWNALFSVAKITKHGQQVLCRQFKKNHYRFNHMIDTDGVSCSIVFIRNDLYGRKWGSRIPTLPPSKDLYVDELPPSKLEHFRTKKVVGIDPGMSDLLYSSNEDGSEQFRYTQNQRRFEQRDRKYRQIMLKERRRYVVDGKTIEQWETVLSTFNSKMVSIPIFEDYIKAKLFISAKIAPFYEQRLYRKLRLNRYYNTRKSEQALIKNFTNVFGTPDKVVVGIGDWEQKKHRKYKEPTKGKGFRTVLKKAGFQVFLVDEFRTSCQCFHCQDEEGKCTKFRYRLDPNTRKPDSKRTPRKVHGLLKCQTCSRLWNRDVHASLSIARLVRYAVEGWGRPSYLSRKPSVTVRPVPSTGHRASVSSLKSTT